MAKTKEINGKIVDLTTGEILKQVEKKARLREIENEKILTDEEMELMNRLQAKAQARGSIIIPEKKVKNRDRYVQIQQLNMAYLRKIKYLTNAEKVFLLDISPLVGIDSNCLVEDIYAKSPIPLTITDIAEAIDRTKNNISPIINSLIDKGILARSETGLEDNNARAYAIFVNPNIMLSGNRDNVNATLKAMFKRVPKDLKSLPTKMF